MPITTDVMDNRVFRDMILEAQARGMAEAKADSLTTLLATRFGTFTPATRAKIARASIKDLDRWFLRHSRPPRSSRSFRPSILS